MEPPHLDNVVLALLFASEEPLSPKKIASMLDDVSVAQIAAALKRLEGRLQREMPSIVLERVAGGLQLSTNAEYAEYVARLYSGRRKHRLSRAAMETLAIIAYKQPITRAEIERVRGVGCGGVITTLMERSLVKIVGKAKVLGAPFLYGTSQEFLEYLGLDSLGDLPSMEELEELLEREESGERAAESEPPPAGDESGAASVETAPEREEADEQEHGWRNQATSDETPEVETNPDEVQFDKPG